MLLEKKVSESRSEHVQIILYNHINGARRLFGGQLLEWIDTIGAVVARRHSCSEVTTASIDNLQFKKGVELNSILVLIGEVTYVGKTSMEVRVDTYVESNSGERIRELVNRAYLVFVALDENGKSKEVPRLILETKEQELVFEAGKLRQQRRKEMLS